MNLEGLTEKMNQRGTFYYEDEVGEVVAKKCRKCNEVKVLDDFGKDKKTPDRRKSTCKKCKYHQDSIYRIKNVEKVAKRHAAYRRNNPEKIAALKVEWQRNNPEKMAARRAKWVRKNPVKVALKGQRRRARKAELPYTLTNDQYQETLKYFENSCSLTGQIENLSQDHALPISCGHGGTTRENIYPISSYLNSSKGEQNLFEWFDANKVRFNLTQERFDKLIRFLSSINNMTIDEYRNYTYWCHENPKVPGEESEAE